MGKQRDANNATFDTFEAEMNEIAKGTDKTFKIKRRAREHLCKIAQERGVPLTKILDEMREGFSSQMRVFSQASWEEINRAASESHDPLGALMDKLKLQ